MNLTCRELLRDGGTWEMIGALAREATDLDAISPLGNTMLILVMLNTIHRVGYKDEIIRNIIVRGGDVDIPGEGGGRAIDRCRDPGPAAYLAELGANIDCMDPEHKAFPVHLAACRWGVRLAVLATPKFCEDMARLIAEMVT